MTAASVREQFSSPLYTVDISRTWGPEYVGYLQDLARMITVQVTMQLMFYMLDPEKYCFFSEDFGSMLLFITLGVSFYWLVFKRLVLIR